MYVNATALSVVARRKSRGLVGLGKVRSVALFPPEAFAAQRAHERNQRLPESGTLGGSRYFEGSPRKSAPIMAMQRKDGGGK